MAVLRQLLRSAEPVKKNNRRRSEIQNSSDHRDNPIRRNLLTFQTSGLSHSLSLLSVSDAKVSIPFGGFLSY